MQILILQVRTLELGETTEVLFALCYHEGSWDLEVCCIEYFDSTFLSCCLIFRMKIEREAKSIVEFHLPPLPVVKVRESN